MADRPVSWLSPLATWFPDDRAIARARRRLGRAPARFQPRDGAWRQVFPRFPVAVAMAGSGLPFQLVADRRYDRSADPRRLATALATGATVYLPQVHQVLPRLMRLIVALRATFLGPFREERSFLFLVEGRGRAGMGLHHDGEVEAFWLQIEGRRTVTIGPRVPPGTPEELPDGFESGGPRPARSPRGAPGGCPGGWWTGDLQPGSLFYLPPRLPHRVVCHGRSLAVSLTWGPPRVRAARRPDAGAAARARSLTAWDVVSGRADPIPRPSRVRLWAQLPATVGPVARGAFALWLPGGQLALPGAAPALRPLAAMSSLPRRDLPRLGPAGRYLVEQGVLAPRDLPLRIVPDDPRRLDGWQFA